MSENTMESRITSSAARVTSLLSSRPFVLYLCTPSALPSVGGVYRIFERDSDWSKSVYVGKTGNLSERIYRNHLMGNRQASTLKRKLIRCGKCADEERVKRYLQSKCEVQFVVIEDKTDRKFFEHLAIGILQPEYND